MVAPLFPEATALLDGSATISALREHAPGSDLLHLACHGQFRPDSPLFSSLRLGDGWLSVRDAYTLDVGAGLVTLSACRGESAVEPLDCGRRGDGRADVGLLHIPARRLAPRGRPPRGATPPDADPPTPLLLVALRPHRPLVAAVTEFSLSRVYFSARGGHCFAGERHQKRLTFPA
jgi:hypothetical protein